MIDELTVPLLGTLDTDPDGIPRGFIHRDPDILNIEQQNTLSKMKVKMIDFNEEYLAKHPQVEALVRLLIKEIVIHKPYYVRDFIKEILSREDLESRVAHIVAAKEINLNRRHTRHYFSHTKTWQDKAAGLGEPEPEAEFPYWPEPRPFRPETRRDKREYCHPHYLKVPYVFFPAEFLKPKEPILTTKKYPHFRSRSYARICLQNYKDIWGDPVVDVPQPFNDEEVYTAYDVMRKKSARKMTNEDLIKCCLRCRRTRLRSYLYAMNKKQFNDPLKRYPSYEILKKSLNLRVANKLLERTIDAIKNKDVRNINCAWVSDNSPINDVDRELIKFETRFKSHQPLADLNNFQSPIPGIRFKEEGAFSMLLPLADLKRNIDGRPELDPRVNIHHPKTVERKRSNKITVPTTDLRGRIVDQSVISITVKSMSPTDEESSCIRLGERKIGTTPPPVIYDEKHLLLEQHGKINEKWKDDETTLPKLGLQSGVIAKKKGENINEKVQSNEPSGISIPSKGSYRGLKREDSSLLALGIPGSSNPERIETYHKENKLDLSMPSLADPYVNLSVNPKILTEYFKERNEIKRDTKMKEKVNSHPLEYYL